MGDVSMPYEATSWYVKAEDGKVYGPATVASLIEWAKDGRVQPTGFLSRDRINWQPAQLMSELEMKWLVEPQPGKVFGPFNRAFVSRLFKDGSLDAKAKVYRLHEYAIDEDPPPVEKIVEKEVRVEVPVEKIVEKIVEVPVEKIVEKIVEVPVEKIVERIVEVEAPPRKELVVPEVIEASGNEPPPVMPGKIFKGMGRSSLAALEAAARSELAKGHRFGMGGGLFGRK